MDLPQAFKKADVKNSGTSSRRMPTFEDLEPDHPEGIPNSRKQPSRPEIGGGSRFRRFKVAIRVQPLLNEYDGRLPEGTGRQLMTLNVHQA
jgi:hypothetical protein